LQPLDCIEYFNNFRAYKLHASNATLLILLTPFSSKKNIPIDAEKAIQELTSKGIKLPTQPKVLVDLKAKLAADNYKMKDLERIIASDPGITAMLFKLAVSPAFNPGKDLTSLEQIIILIGVQQTYNLVQAISLTNTLSDSSRKSFDVFWTRSQEIAKLAALIAEDRVSICNIFPDQAYMAGIFHQCGIPVLMLRFPSYCGKFNLGSNSFLPDLKAEDELYKVDHCTMGYLVARHWSLPDFICKAILYSHDEPGEELGVVRTLVAMLQLAVHYHHLITRIDHPEWLHIRQEVLSELGIHVDDEQEYFDEISEQFFAS
jgi:HD-like signal output (HDOD) protein